MHLANQYTSKNLLYSDLGFIDYKTAWDLQTQTFDKRVAGTTDDTFFMLEHPNTYTLGKTADKNNLIGSKEFLES
ncbi:MAG TPA: hypothetical protein PL041_07415, partial [Melioribacteraceae bacterium]|nr:hypothetical protein [Melioribacteraceae bacterium]